MKIIKQGKKLGLDEPTITDMIFVGSRIKKPISANELINQMNNYMNIVLERSFPYRFNSFDDYMNFKGDLDDLLGKYDIQGEIRIQGSSLRTPNAKDVDIGVFVTQEEFDNIVQRSIDDIKERNKGKRHGGYALIEEIIREQESGRINTYYLYRLEDQSTTINKEIYDLIGYTDILDYPFDLSIMVDDGSFDLLPYMN